MLVDSRVQDIYKEYEVIPYILPERDLETWLLEWKLVPKRNMVLLDDGLLTGYIN